MWKLENLVFASPPKPHIGPPDPPNGPGRPKMAQITIIQSSGDISWQKINFGGSKKKCVFFHSDRPCRMIWLEGLTEPWLGCIATSSAVVASTDSHAWSNLGRRGRHCLNIKIKISKETQEQHTGDLLNYETNRYHQSGALFLQIF